MTRISLDLLNLFVEPPGDFLYFLVVIALCQASLFMALGQRSRQAHNRAAGRYGVAFLGITTAWILLLAGALFSLFSGQDAARILPPLERAVTTASLLLTGWAFLTADHDRYNRASSILVLLLLIVTIAGYTLSGINWATLSATVFFNLSPYGIAWAFATAVLALLGMFLTLLLFRDVLDAPLKLIFFLLILVGQGITIYFMVNNALPGNYAGLARLTFVLALAIVPVVTYRMVVGQLHTAVQTVLDARPSLTVTRDRSQSQPMVMTSPEANIPRIAPIETQSIQLLKFLGMVLEASDPVSIPEKIMLASLDMLRAEVGAILRFQDANYADIALAFDKVRERRPSGLALNLDQQPTLTNALERREQRVLYTDRDEDELRDLFTRLDIDQVGPAYFQPLVRQQEVVAVLVVALPYSGRELTTPERELLRSMATISSNLLAISYEAQEASIQAEERTIQAMVEGVNPALATGTSSALVARQEMEASLQLARDQITQLSRQVMELKLTLDDERTRLAALVGATEEGLSISQRITAINEEQEHLRQDRDRLAKRLQEAETMLGGATASSDEAAVQHMIEALRKEKETLTIERERLLGELDNLRAHDLLVPQELQVVVNRMIDEKGRLQAERDQLGDKLATIQSQLLALGIDDGVAALPSLLGRLYEERATLKTQLETLQKDRDALLNERTRFAGDIQTEKERDSYIQTLQTQIQNLAADREVALKQATRLKTERAELLEKVDTIKENRAREMAKAAAYEIELTEAYEEQSRLRGQVQELADDRSQLMKVRDNLSAEIQRLQTMYNQLNARIEGNQSQMQRLGEEGVNSLRQMINDLTGERDSLQRELSRLHLAFGEVENQLDVSQKMAAVTVNNADAAPKYRPQQPDLLMGLVQELRTPMTSITGYVDLLLGESAGILGEMQRKFLQRVSANITRLETMIQDLVHVTELDTGQFQLDPAPVDVVGLIENAITHATIQFREKGLEVNMVLDDDLPNVPADKDALNQIIGQLLTNAYLVSPPDTEVLVTAQHATPEKTTKQGNPIESIYVAVEDRGGGIQPEDIPRVFARKYKADNPLIAGLGDTGVGMSIARALVEAHGGQLQLEVKPGIGSIFSFTLPLLPITKE